MLFALFFLTMAFSTGTAAAISPAAEESIFWPRTNPESCACDLGDWCCNSLNYHCGYVYMAGGWSCFPDDKSVTSLILGPASFASASASTRTPTSSLVGQSSKAVATGSVSEANTNPTVSSSLVTITSSGSNNPTSAPAATSMSPSSLSFYCISFFGRSYRAASIFLIAALVFM